MRASWWIAAAALVLSQPAFALTIVTCGPSKGYVVYPAGPFHPEPTPWETDDQDTKISLEVNDGEFDVVWQTGERRYSSRENAGKVTVVDDNEAGILLSIVWPKERVESFNFRFGEKPDLVWSQNRGSMLLAKLHAGYAACRKP